MKALSTVILTFILSAAATGASADQADQPAATGTGNAELVSDYVFRGLTQSWGDAALQGGGDLSTKSGFAAGFWGSTISKNIYPGALMELDLYGDYGASFNDDWSWTVGLHSYLYPRGNLDQATPPLASRGFNTLEANAALTWKWLTVTYNRSLTDYFGIDTEEGYTGNSKGTVYLQLDAGVPVADGWTLGLHAAHTHIPTQLAAPLTTSAADPSYADYGASLKWQFAGHWSGTLGFTRATNAAFYGSTASFNNPSDTKNVGGTRGYVMVQTTF
jgi:uncharacterized protein (TIGR02001 family)